MILTFLPAVWVPVILLQPLLDLQVLIMPSCLAEASKGVQRSAKHASSVGCWKLDQYGDRLRGDVSPGVIIGVPV